MKHLDLFSGLGGFAIAVDTVWPGSEHIFCDNDKFCQQVLKKHWPKSKIYNDIREITTNTTSERFRRGSENGTKKSAGLFREDIKKNQRGIITDTRSKKSGRISGEQWQENKKIGSCDILTGGFPCQPFSQAGKRRGTEDDRYLWPEMLRVIQLTKPTWVIAENVRGLLTLQGGVVFEQVCLDLESNGYEVQPFVIPAVAVNAPHRRDRVWIIAHSKKWGLSKSGESRTRRNGFKDEIINTSNAESGESGKQTEQKGRKDFSRGDWEANWLKVATKLCRVDAGLPAKLDGFELSKARHRVERLKSLGNAIVPQVAIEIMRAIKNKEKC